MRIRTSLIAAATLALAATATAGDGGCAGDIDGDGVTGLSWLLGLASSPSSFVAASPFLLRYFLGTTLTSLLGPAATASST